MFFLAPETDYKELSGEDRMIFRQDVIPVTKVPRKYYEHMELLRN